MNNKDIRKEEYFSHLSRISNKAFSYDRLGSTSANNISKMIDIYEVRDQTGTKFPNEWAWEYFDESGKKMFEEVGDPSRFPAK